MADPRGTPVGLIVSQGWPARRVSQSLVGPVSDSYSSWPRGICTAPHLGVRLHRGEPREPQPVTSIPLFCNHFRFCGASVASAPADWISPARSPPPPPAFAQPFTNSLPATPFIASEGEGVSNSQDFFSLRVQRQAKPYVPCHLASPLPDRVVVYDEYHLITVRHG